MDNDREMVATILGTNAGLAILVRLLLAGRTDLEEIARKADELLMAHTQAMKQPPRDFEMAIDEQAQRTVANLIADARGLGNDKRG